MKLNKFKYQASMRLKNYPKLYWHSMLVQSWCVSLFSPSKKTCCSEKFIPHFMLIVGSGRSGSTLLRRLMMEHLDIFIPPETYVLPKIADYRIKARGLKWTSLVDLIVSGYEYHPEFETFNVANLREYAIKAKSWEKEKQTIHMLIYELYYWMAEHFGMPSSWIGDKKPINTLYLNSISKILPRSKYIYILRDGVDVSVSYIQSGIYENIQDAAFRWVRSHKSWQNFKKSLYDNEYLELRYEDLVMNPFGMMQLITNKFDISERHGVDILSLLGDVPQRPHHANVLFPVSIDSIGKGRRSLSGLQKKQIRPILNRMLSQVGYNTL